MVLAVLVVALVVGAFAAYDSQLFEVRSVTVVGNTRLPVARVVSEAGIARGETLLRIPAEAVRARLLRDPWILSASVERSFPDTVTIRVGERDPVGIVAVGATPWLVDGSGVFVAPRSALPHSPLPLIQDVGAIPTATPGAASTNASLANAAKVVAGLSPELKAATVSVSARSIGETAIFTTNRVEIFIGEAIQMPQKDFVLRKILIDLRRQHAVVVSIDVRSWRKPIVRVLGR